VDGVRRQFAGRNDELRRVFALVRERWGDLADRMVAAFTEDAQRRTFEEAHAGSDCARTSTALAALYMVETRHEVERVIREQHPGQDVEHSISRALDALELCSPRVASEYRRLPVALEMKA
jgi:hypothetical protein